MLEKKNNLKDDRHEKHPLCYRRRQVVDVNGLRSLVSLILPPVRVYNKVSSYLIGSVAPWKSVSPCIMVITCY